jgi:hypothetical protein
MSLFTHEDWLLLQSALRQELKQREKKAGAAHGGYLPDSVIERSEKIRGTMKKVAMMLDLDEKVAQIERDMNA